MKHTHLAVAAFLLAAPAAWASPNLVQNGDFSQTTNGAGNTTGLGEFIPTGGGNHDPSLSVTSITDWNTILTPSNQGAPFLFVVDPTTLDTTGFLDSWDYGNRHLWGSHNGGNDVIGPAPTGPDDGAAHGRRL